MDTETINKIYDRLLEIKIELEPDLISEPSQLNSKIVSTHFYISEVEKYYIRTSKELSLVQRSLNNAVAAFESKKQDILSNNIEVKELPNIKDREARANQMLKVEYKQIKDFENALGDLKNLLRAINLKLKNLNRVNNDIKNQLRIMEAQIRIGYPPSSDKGLRDLTEELNKSIAGKNIFAQSDSLVKREENIEFSEKPSDQSLVNDVSKDFDNVDELLDLDDDNDDTSEAEDTHSIATEESKMSMERIFGDQPVLKGGTENRKVTEVDLNIDELLSDY